jgi:hypothetical protein
MKSSDEEAEFSKSSSEPESVKRDDEWDDECYVCGKEGDVMCCEGCSRVAHSKCVNLKQKLKDEEDWYCEVCEKKRARLRAPTSNIRSFRSNKR